MNVLSLFDGLSGGQIALNRAGIKCDKYFASEVDKYAIAVTQHNYPDTIQLGDVLKVRAKDLPRIDLLIGGSPCFVGGTKIICEDGYKNIEDVVVGDSVLTHKGRFKKVIAIGSEKKETYNLKAQGVFDTETTDNHPYYVREMCRKWDNDIRSSYRYFSDPIWKPVIDLKKDDFVGIPILKKEVNSLDITKEEAYIIGRYAADGHTRKDYRTSENRPNHRHWQLILSIGANKLTIFNQKVTENKFSCYLHTKNVYRCVFSSKRLVQMAEKHCGFDALNKKLSMELLNLPIDILDSLLTGYLDGDGSVRGDEIRANSISKELMQTIGLAIVKIYKVPVYCGKTIRPTKTIIEGREVNQHNSYEISFRKTIKKQTNAYVDNDFVWTRFKSTGKTNEIKTVYNISVEGDESYIANNLVVHNCQGFSFAGKQLNFDDPRSKLFFEFVRLLEECNPKYFLLENVKMKKESQDVISKYLGVEPIEINSALVSAQNRKRLYWTNIPDVTQPEDKGILLKDVLEYGEVDRDKSYCIDANYYKGGSVKNYKEKKRRQLVQLPVNFCQSEKRLMVKVKTIPHGYIKESVDIKDKYPFLCAQDPSSKHKLAVVDDLYKNREKRVYEEKCCTLRHNCGQLNVVDNVTWRKLTPIECERLQTVPDNYTLVPHPLYKGKPMSNSQRYKMLGNGWTVDVVAHIFKNIT